MATRHTIETPRRGHIDYLGNTRPATKIRTEIKQKAETGQLIGFVLSSTTCVWIHLIEPTAKIIKKSAMEHNVCVDFT